MPTKPEMALKRDANAAAPTIIAAGSTQDVRSSNNWVLLAPKSPTIAPKRVPKAASTICIAQAMENNVFSVSTLGLTPPHALNSTEMLKQKTPERFPVRAGKFRLV